jgi:hypothetical protein
VADDTPTHSPVRAHPAGVKTQDGGKQAKVQKLQPKETLMVNIGSTATGGKVLALREDTGRREDLARILLTQPVCTQEGEKIALSRRVDKHWRLIGWGQIRRCGRALCVCVCALYPLPEPTSTHSLVPDCCVRVCGLRELAGAPHSQSKAHSGDFLAVFG